MKKSVLLLIPFLFWGCGDNANLYLGGGGGIFNPSQNPPSPTPQRPNPARPGNGGSLPYEGVLEMEFQQRKKSDKVDLLFSIDHSGSMDPYIQNVANNISVFVNYLLKEKVNFQMGFLISSDVENGGENGVRPGLVGPHPVIKATDQNVSNRVVDNLDSILAEHSGGFEIGVTVLERAINFPLNRVLFRPDAAKAFVVLTDADDDLSDENTVSHFMDFFDHFAGNYPWSMIGIGYPTGAEDCGVEDTNHRLLERLVALSGGVMGNICDDDYSNILAKAADRVTRLLEEFSLARYPELADAEILSMKVTVDNVEVPADPVNGYVFSQKNLSIVFKGNAIPKEGAVIKVYIQYRMKE